MSNSKTFVLPKSTGLEERSFDVECDSKGNTFVSLEDALKMYGARPLEVMDMFKSDPAMIDRLLRLELEWDNKKKDPKKQKPCVVCGAVAEKTVLRCSGCMSTRVEVIYCGKECQKADWKQHKKVCGKNVTAETRDRLLQAIGRIKDA